MTPEIESESKYDGWFYWKLKVFAKNLSEPRSCIPQDNSLRFHQQPDSVILFPCGIIMPMGDGPNQWVMVIYVRAESWFLF